MDRRAAAVRFNASAIYKNAPTTGRRASLNKRMVQRYFIVTMYCEFSSKGGKPY